jgi:hypothetical protein
MQSLQYLELKLWWSLALPPGNTAQIGVVAPLSTAFITPFTNSWYPPSPLTETNNKF